MACLFAYHGLQFAIEHVPAESGRGTSIRSFMETCCRATGDFWRDDRYHSLRLGFVQWLSPYIEESSLVDELGEESQPKDGILPMKPLINETLVALGRLRRFCVTERGFFGLVPSDCRPGDKVFILGGSAVPFILGPAGADPGDEDGGTRYKLIGDGYI